MSTEIAIPFSLLSPQGTVAVTSSPEVQTGQHVDSLVSTNPGERAMIPGYGVPLIASMFKDTDSVATEVVNDVITAMKTWEPSVTVANVSVIPGQDTATGLVQVEVDYITPSSGNTNPAAISTATVLVGGTVLQQVSP
jgi:uncharacterized protein